MLWSCARHGSYRESAIASGLGVLYPAYRPRSLTLSEFVTLFRRGLELYLIDGAVTLGATTPEPSIAERKLRIEMNRQPG